jgi:hypothetical protein
VKSVKRRATAMPRRAAPPRAGGGSPGGALARDRTQPAASDQAAAVAAASRGPVIVLSYAYAGAGRVQSALAAGSGLACTSGTGIIPQCAAAAETWRRIEGQQGPAPLSRLAAAAIRGLVTAQITAILASSGQPRWCELATASPDAADAFLQVFPHARFVCVQRSCLDMVRAGVRASPWGLHDQGFTPFLLAYPGNSVAALAGYWVSSAEQLLAFERANPHATYRVRYEDATAQPALALAAVRAALGLGDRDGADGLPVQPGWLADPADSRLAEPGAKMPAGLIPEPLLRRIGPLHAELGYPPPEW